MVRTAFKYFLLALFLGFTVSLFAIGGQDEMMILDKLKNDKSLQGAMGQKTKMLQDTNQTMIDENETTWEDKKFVFTRSELKELDINRTTEIIKEELNTTKRRDKIDMIDANQEIFDSYFMLITKKDIFSMTNDELNSLLAMQFKEMSKDQLDEIYILLKQKEFAISKYRRIFEKKGKYYDKFTPFAYEDQMSLIEKLEKETPAMSSEAEQKPLKRFGENFFKNKKSEYLTNIPVPDNYVLATGDMVSLSIYGSETIDNQTQIDRDGNINVPRAGAIKIGGLEYSEAKTAIESKLKTSYPNSTIVFSVGDLRSSTVTVAGEVKRPGSYTLNALAKVKDALIASGGINDVGSMRNIEVLRNSKVVAKFDLYQLIRGGKSKGDIVLRAGDVVYVPVAKTLVSFDGAVKVPAIYELKDTETLADLVKFGGGLTSSSIKILKVEKTNGDEKEVVEVPLNTKIKLSDGDKVFTEKLIDTAKNRVYIKGNVYTKGFLEIGKNETVGSLIKKQIKQVGINRLFMPDTDMGYFLVKRINKDTSSHEVLSGNLEAALSGDSKLDVALQAGDEIYIFNNSITEDIKYVSVDGEVIRQGKFKYFPGMKLIDAVKTAGLKKNSDTSKITVVSQNKDKSLSISSYSLEEAVSVPLKQYDRVTVDNFYLIQQIPSIRVMGGVNQPGDFNTTKPVKINDLIDFGRGFAPNVQSDFFELTKFWVDNGVRKSKVLKLSLNDAMKNGMLINPYEEVRIPQMANWDSNRTVKLKGQVKYPGEYSIAPGEKLASVIDRAGGFLPDAFIDGAIFTRADVKKMQKDAMQRQLAELDSKMTYLATQPAGAGEDANQKAMLLKSLDTIKESAKKIEPLGRVSVKLDPNVKRFANSSDNITLKPGDELIVPEQEDSILLVGEVMNPTAVVYRPDEDVMSYVNRGGGLKDSADEDAIFILRANGEAEKVKRSYMLGYGSSTIRRGDTVVVPLKVQTVAGLKMATDITTIFFNLAAGLASMKAVGAL